jgi:hypothetical protein
MFRFFIEIGLFYVAAVAALTFLKVLPDENLAWRYSIYFTLAVYLIYQPIHYLRRVRLGVRMPLLSLLVMIGYVINTIIVALTLLEIGLSPSFNILAWLLLYGLITNIAIFVQFFGSFVYVREEADVP